MIFSGKTAVSVNLINIMVLIKVTAIQFHHRGDINKFYKQVVTESGHGGGEVRS